MLDTLNTLSKEQLTELLVEIKALQRFKKISTKRGYDMYRVHSSDEQVARVEHAFELDNATKNTIVDIYNTVFGMKISSTDVLWNKNENIKGGVRLFLWDDLIDVSLAWAKQALGL